MGPLLLGLAMVAFPWALLLAPIVVVGVGAWLVMRRVRMIRLNGSRLLAIAVVAMGLGWWTNGRLASHAAHFETLSCNDLMAAMKEAPLHPVALAVPGILFVVVVVVVVDLLSSLFDRMSGHLRRPAAASRPPMQPPGSAA